MELDKDAAQAEIRELRRKLADISNQSDSDNETPRVKKVRANSDNVSMDMAREDQVTKMGYLFVMMYGPWLQLGAATFKTKYNGNFCNSERFNTTDTKVQGQLHEIMEIMDPHLSQEISEPWLAKAVCFCFFFVFKM